jgi:hypothetical protein
MVRERKGGGDGEGIPEFCRTLKGGGVRRTGNHDSMKPPLSHFLSHVISSPRPSQISPCACVPCTLLPSWSAVATRNDAKYAIVLLGATFSLLNMTRPRGDARRPLLESNGSVTVVDIGWPELGVADPEDKG